MKKFAVITFILLSVFQLKAQDEAYIAEVKGLIEMGAISSNWSAENFNTMFVALFTQAKNQLPYKTDEERTNAAMKYADMYYQTQAKQDISEIIAPYYAKHLVIEELRTINSTIEQEKYNGAYRKLSGGELQGLVQQKAMEVTISLVGAISQGKEPESILEADEKNSNYYLTFEKYKQQVGMDKFIANMSNGLMGNAANDEQKTFMNKITPHLEKAVSETLYLAYKEKVTEEELKTIIELYEKPEFKKMTLATNEISADAMNIGMKFLQKIGGWLDTQNIQ